MYLGPARGREITEEMQARKDEITRKRRQREAKKREEQKVSNATCVCERMLLYHVNACRGTEKYCEKTYHKNNWNS